MNRQRFAIFIVGMAGLVATFLPWYDIEMLGTLTGVFSSGWFTFIMFLSVLLLALRKDLRKALSKVNLWCMSLFGVAAGTVVLWRIVDIRFAGDMQVGLSGSMDGIMADEVTVRYGAWLVVAAGFCVLLAALLFRREDRIGKEGED